MGSIDIAYLTTGVRWKLARVMLEASLEHTEFVFYLIAHRLLSILSRVEIAEEVAADKYLDGYMELIIWRTR